MASHVLGEPSWGAAGLLPAISSVSFAVFSSCHPSQDHLGRSGRSMGIAGAIPVPWTAPCSRWSLQTQRESSWAAREQPLPVPRCPSQRQEPDVVYKTKLLWCSPGEAGMLARVCPFLERIPSPSLL